MSAYNPEQYWENLLEAQFSLKGVGHPWLPESFNRIIYRACERATERVLVGQNTPWDQMDVLDIGCGTGYWVEYWRARGVSQITGLDLTATSVHNLQRAFPTFAFHQCNISDAAVPPLGPFDLISAMNVLLHVTDPDRFEQALRNIRGYLKPAGLLVMIEPVVVNTWWGPPLDRTAHAQVRTLQQWREILDRAQLEIRRMTPVTYLLADPVDTKARWSFRLLARYWSLLCRALRSHETLGAVTGSGLYGLDRLLLSLGGDGTSAKCLLIAPKAPGK
jgi:SAM-dependent methyltransferase